MENLILKIRARDALNNILKQNNSTKYQQLCLYVEYNYSEIEKEIAFALEPVWSEIAAYANGSFLKKVLIRLHYTLTNNKAEIVLSDEIVESIVDTMLPDIIAFFETEEGRKEFEEWKSARENKEAVG